MTGDELTVRELGARIESADADVACSGGDPPLHELRIDALAAPDDELFGLVGRHGGRVVGCCRPDRQGGRYRGEEADRIALLRRAQAAGARWIDLEADVADEALHGLDRQRVLLSWHDFAGVPADGERLLARMAARGTGALKLACRLEDAAELGPLVDLAARLAMPVVLVGMGPAGMLSRIHYAAFGSPWTYVAASPARATAAGQPTLAQALALGLPGAARAPLLGLVGGEQVMRSPGPAVYNALLRSRGLPYAYVPVLTRSLARLVPLLARTGLVDLSVTMPLKEQAYHFCRADAVAQAAQAVNSLRSAGTGWEGTNTDVVGIERPLRALRRRLSRAVILGSGGAARAAIVACRNLGLEVVVCARRAGAVVDLADRVVDWERRGAVDLSDAVLVNATPLTGEESPWPPPLPLAAAAVFDLALGAERSQLLARASAAGSATLGALEMWLCQGAAQMSWLLGEPVTAEELAGWLP